MYVRTLLEYSRPNDTADELYFPRRFRGCRIATLGWRLVIGSERCL
eukprot:SAG25_NODE_7484_length_478_cov_0.878628_1_plen_45_part_10